MRILSTFFVAVFLIAIVACFQDKRDNNTAAQQQDQTEIQGQNDSQTETIVSEDDSGRLQANYNENKGDEVEENESESNETTASDNYNQEKWQQYNQPSKEETTDSAGSNLGVSLLCVLLCVLLGASALVLCAYNFYVLRKREDEQWHVIDKLRKDNESNLIKMQWAFKECAPDKDFKNIADKVLTLESKVYSLECEILKTRITGSGRDVKAGSEDIAPPKTGYFGIPRGNADKLILFNERWDYQADKAYFKVEYIDELNCNFYPFDLEKLRSVDAVKKAVDFTGSSMQYAKKMKVNQKGFAVYDQENEYWRLIDKAIIELMN